MVGEMNDASLAEPPALQALLQVRGQAISETMAQALRRWVVDPHFSDERPALIQALEAATQEEPAWAELQDAFRQLLPIGTGGRRGKVAPGPNRVNSVTLRETVYGLYCTMQEQGWPSAVIVGYDTRCDSRSFAEQAVRLLLHLDVQVYWLDAPRPTPQIAFWLRKLGCGAGVVISASHNPPGDNGIKVYGPDGAQVFGERDKALTKAIVEQGGKAPGLDSIKDPGALRSHSKLTNMDIESADQGYVQEVLSRGVCPEVDLGRCGPVVYTALQGVGYPNLRSVIEARGGQLLPVPEQCDAGDGRFSKTRATNPEDPRAFDAAMELALAKGAKVILANDPDADRLGLCLWSATRNAFEVIEGNEVCAMLAWHVCTQDTPSDTSLVVSTLVTSSLVPKIAQARGFLAVSDLLVGFKNHAAYVQAHPELELAFGCEESLGYIRGRNIRDKDGAIAALLVCELLARLAERGETWEERRNALWCEYGVHLNHTENLRFEGQSGALAMQRVMRAWRQDPPGALGVYQCKGWVDRAQANPAVDDSVRGAQSNLMVGEFERSQSQEKGSTSQVRVVLRPSGTEPKLKLYLLFRSPPCEPSELSALHAELEAHKEELLQDAKTKVMGLAIDSAADLA